MKTSLPQTARQVLVTIIINIIIIIIILIIIIIINIITSPASLKHREVEHFGYNFDYSINGVHRNQPLHEKPLPLICTEFLENLQHEGLFQPEQFPNQLTINRYPPGAGMYNGLHSAIPTIIQFQIRIFFIKKEKDNYYTNVISNYDRFRYTCALRYAFNV